MAGSAPAGRALDERSTARPAFALVRRRWQVRPRGIRATEARRVYGERLTPPLRRARPRSEGPVSVVVVMRCGPPLVRGTGGWRTSGSGRPRCRARRRRTSPRSGRRTARARRTRSGAAGHRVDVARCSTKVAASSASAMRRAFSRSASSPGTTSWANQRARSRTHSSATRPSCAESDRVAGDLRQAGLHR